MRNITDSRKKLIKIKYDFLLFLQLTNCFYLDIITNESNINPIASGCMFNIEDFDDNLNYKETLSTYKDDGMIPYLSEKEEFNIFVKPYIDKFLLNEKLKLKLENKPTKIKVNKI